MEWLNYHHLLYFWIVAREGSITRACAQLSLAQPTISSQIRALEDAFGQKLFIRSARKLLLTESGKLVFRYANEIFHLGRDLQEALKGRSTTRPVPLFIGISGVMPKLVAYRLIEPALQLAEPSRIICVQDTAERLLVELGTHGLDVVLADAPIGGQVSVRAFNHLLGESAVSIFGATKLVTRHRRAFPRSLQGAPFLLPSEGTELRRSVNHWFDSQKIRPVVVGEFDDDALLKAFGQAGRGLFFMPSVIETEIRRQYKVGLLGRLRAVRQQFFAISSERRIKHPAVAAITEAAREKFFA